jgi:hypothetical protein
MSTLICAFVGFCACSIGIALYLLIRAINLIFQSIKNKKQRFKHFSNPDNVAPRPMKWSRLSDNIDFRPKKNEQ